VFWWSRRHICGPDVATLHWQWFLEGYSSARGLDEAELRSIPYFVPCRELWLAAYGLLFRDRDPHRPGNEKLLRSVQFVRTWMDELAAHQAATASAAVVCAS